MYGSVVRAAAENIFSDIGQDYPAPSWRFFDFCAVFKHVLYLLKNPPPAPVKDAGSASDMSVYCQARRWPGSSSTDRVRRAVLERRSAGGRRLLSISVRLRLCARASRPAQRRRLDLPATVSVHHSL